MKKFKEYLLITIGIIIVAVGLEFFFFPNKIASGGIAGLALVLQDIFNLDAGPVMFICNGILFVLAFFFIGGNFGVKSIYAGFGVSIILSAIEKFGLATAITDNLMLATFFGSAVTAVGSAVVFSQGASTGGTSITAKLLSKYFSMDIGKGLLISDSVVILLAMYNFGIELGLFGLLSVYLSSTLIDKFIDGFNSCKQVIIFTDQEELVVNYIMKDVDRGCTVFNGKGGYTGESNSVIFTVLNRRQFIQLKQFMKAEDPNAFITVNEAQEVLGKGFGNIIED
ncbi:MULTISPECIES: YitT family protein [Clostridium]|uniref:YitT family protein n=1 Tax=Clostridium cibarium TaxID=2762247 RepID=A0ABR8PSG4_9CLOT|nr:MULTISPECIES: YitT family protein [Clostridium]MBD7911115.1 YitT family protein [Clostridium cibarium]